MKNPYRGDVFFYPLVSSEALVSFWSDNSASVETFIPERVKQKQKLQLTFMSKKNMFMVPFTKVFFKIVNLLVVLLLDKLCQQTK